MLSLRLMHRADAPAITLIDRMSNALPWSLQSYLREGEKPHSRVWVACQRTEKPVHYENPLDGAPPSFTAAADTKALVGFAVIWLILDEAHVANIAVHPAFRQRGIGRRLLIHALNDARAQGMTSALLEVRAGNQAALALYRHLGFEIVGRRKHYYRDNHEDALLMTLQPLRPLKEV